MVIEAISYCRGTSQDPNRGRIALQLFNDERFVVSYRHHEVVKIWGGRVAPGTFTRAFEALSAAGFPEVPRVPIPVPDESPIELGWLRDKWWQRSETLDRDQLASFIIVTSTILSELDSDFARMPAGETTPVIEQRRFDPG